VRALGIDPATNIVELARAKGVPVVNEYFTPELARRVRAEHGPAKVVVTTNTFHHIGDLDPFTNGVASLLDDDGVFIVEVPHALELVELNQFDGVYHEHVSQHTVKSFVDHFRLFGLEVFDVEHLDVHGGSIRVFARPARGVMTALPAVQAWIDEEAARGLFNPVTYDAFRERVHRIRDELMELLRDLKAAGRIVGYGALARGNTLLNFTIASGRLLDYYLVDRNRSSTASRRGCTFPSSARNSSSRTGPITCFCWRGISARRSWLSRSRLGAGGTVLPIQGSGSRS
jgi:SAM-dependent methyltransferase